MPVRKSGSARAPDAMGPPCAAPQGRDTTHAIQLESHHDTPSVERRGSVAMRFASCASMAQHALRLPA